MRHPLVPSLEVLGAIALNDLSDHSFLGSNPEKLHFEDLRGTTNPSYAPSGMPGPILYVDRMPRRRRTDDCHIVVGTIAAWRSMNGASQGVFFEQMSEALDFILLARRGIYTRDSFVYRAASITKFNDDTGTDEHSIVVDAQLQNDRSADVPEWITPWHVDPITRL